jgi:membrane dipeptidase
MLIFDAHLDLAMNAIEWNRDFSRPIEEIRAREAHLHDRPDRGRGTVSFAEMRRGGIGLCVATQIARYVKRTNALPGWHSPEQAWAMTQAQRLWYREMERRGEMTAITSRDELDRHLARWSETESAGHELLPIGYVLSLEGADSLVTPAYAERAWAAGVRAIGPAHYGPGTYAGGTNATGGLSAAGRELLAEMDRLGFVLDVTHLNDESLREALDRFRGPLWASHSNCRALVPHHRQFSDDQIRELIARGAVIGAVLDAWMLVPDWVRGVSTPQAAGLTLDRVIDHMDHICQIAGTARHVAIGSDLDGAFGAEQTPGDVDTIADLARLPDLLRARGSGEDDIRLVAHGNVVRFLGDAWRRRL